MRALVVYESMYGNTRHIAEAIAEGLRLSLATDLMVVTAAEDVDLDDVSLLVVGAPTHSWGLSSIRTRSAAHHDPRHPDHLLDSPAYADGVREWLRHLPRQPHHLHKRGVAFDTRLDKPKMVTGSAARGIEHGLRAAGFSPFGANYGFVVTGSAGPLASGEIERAHQWGEAMGRMIVGMSQSLPERADSGR
jgi:flavodoxin-like protein